MLYPTLPDVQKALTDHRLAPVFREVLSDTCTPIHIFHALQENEETCFILESVENSQQWGRYSYIGIRPKAEIMMKNGFLSFRRDGTSTKSPIENPIAFLSCLMEEYHSAVFPDQPKLTSGLIGYFAYDTVRYMEKKLSNPPEDDLDMPDCHLFLYDEIIAFDHLSNKAVIILNISQKGDTETQYRACEKRAEELAEILRSYVPAPKSRKPTGDLQVRSNVTKQDFLDNVEKAKEHILGGDIFQIVLSQRFELDQPPEPFDVYRMLRATNPSPYLYFFKHPDYQIAGASPEMLVNVTNGVVFTKPIAGTMPRGKTPEEDQNLEQSLRADPKERAEHTMLVDLGRNDIGKICEFGSVDVTDFMKIERYSKVMHMVSDVQGKLRDDKTAIDALLAVLPAGTLSGAPKVRAMELIDELENKRRGLYGGTVGYLGFDGNINTCIAIRTVLFKNQKAYVQAGAGIVADSVPEKEFAETQNKALAVINAIQEAAKL